MESHVYFDSCAQQPSLHVENYWAFLLEFNFFSAHLMRVYASWHRFLIMHVSCRQTGMGFVSTMARTGSMAAPAVLILDEVTEAKKFFAKYNPLEPT